MYINIYLERERARGETRRKKRDILWVAVVWADVDSHGNELYILIFFFREAGGGGCGGHLQKSCFLK